MSKLVGVGLGWGCIQAGVVLFQDQILTGVILVFHLGEVLFKSGVAFKRIRYKTLWSSKETRLKGL